LRLLEMKKKGVKRKGGQHSRVSEGTREKDERQM
jgi:hypothetical protein